jgi:hypothetical protein
MVLVVPPEKFSASAEMFRAKQVFLSPRGTDTFASCADLSRNVIVTSVFHGPMADIEGTLQSEGFDVFHGQWSDKVEVTGPEGNPIQDVYYVAAVSYISRESMPGLWMDAYPTSPTPQIVIRAMYDEFKSNGEIGSATYEEFLSMAKPNVVILNPSEIATFVLQKSEC